MVEKGALAVVPDAAHQATRPVSERPQASEASRKRHIEDLIAVVELLAQDGELPVGYRPHKLSGEWKGVWECHIEPDWLLIYEVTSVEVVLIRTGTHLDLFT